MKLYFLPLICTLSLWPVSQSVHFPRTVISQALSCDDIPELNKQIIDFVNANMNRKVGRGECWDLAAQALNAYDARWDKRFRYGQEVDPKKDCIYPGDMMQFENIELEYTQDKKHFKEKMAQHTAIIYEIKGTGDFVLADQNTSIHGRKVGLSPMNLKNITKGKYWIYRPVKKKES